MALWGCGAQNAVAQDGPVHAGTRILKSGNMIIEVDGQFQPMHMMQEQDIQTGQGQTVHMGGSFDAQQHPFSGRMDDVMIFDRGISRVNMRRFYQDKNL